MGVGASGVRLGALPMTICPLNRYVHICGFWSLVKRLNSSLTDINPSRSRSASPDFRPSTTADVNRDGLALPRIASPSNEYSVELEAVITTTPFPAGKEVLMSTDGSARATRPGVNAPL